MPGLIEDANDAGDLAVNGLSLAAKNSVDQYIQGLQQRNAERAGLGQVAGSLVGYAAQRKKDRDKPPQQPGQQSPPAAGAPPAQAPAAEGNPPALQAPAGQPAASGTPSASSSSLFGWLMHHLGGWFLGQHDGAANDTGVL